MLVALFSILHWLARPWCLAFGCRYKYMRLTGTKWLVPVCPVCDHTSSEWKRVGEE